MFNRRNRLHKNRDIRRVLQKGSKLSNSTFRAHYLVGNRLGNPRATVYVSAKVFKKATARNRIKRLIRHRFEQFIQQFPTTPVDVMIGVHSDASPQVLEADWKDIMYKLGTRVSINR